MCSTGKLFHCWGVCDLSVVFAWNVLFLMQTLCGLPISTYFSAVKLRWLIDNSERVQNAVKEDRCLFGTVDSWLIWVILRIRSDCMFLFYTYMYPRCNPGGDSQLFGDEMLIEKIQWNPWEVQIWAWLRPISNPKRYHPKEHMQTTFQSI